MLIVNIILYSQEHFIPSFIYFVTHSIFKLILRDILYRIWSSTILSGSHFHPILQYRMYN